MRRRESIRRCILAAFIAAVTVVSSCMFRTPQANADSEQVPDEVRHPEHMVRWGICIDSFDVEDCIIGNGEVLSQILSRYGVSRQRIHDIDRMSDSTFNVRKIRANRPYHIVREHDSLATARYFVYDISSVEYVVFSLTDSLFSYMGQMPVDTLLKTISGSITSSLWNAMIACGAAPELAGKLSDVYSWTIDFFGVQKGDSFKVYYQDLYADSVRIGSGTILGANFITGGKDHYAFYYRYRDDRGEYFSEDGTSLRRAFLKAPLSYSRISSHFSNARVHPITKVVRAHHGVDYAAPAGTPVYSIGDGVVTVKGWDAKGGGNYLKIKHNATYTTEYMHLKGFANGIAQGVHVSQGQLIGYVGSTGLSTGPHLDFRVFKNGTAINPLSMDLPAVDPIKPEDMPAYIQSTASVMRLFGLEVPEL